MPSNREIAEWSYSEGLLHTWPVIHLSVVKFFKAVNNSFSYSRSWFARLDEQESSVVAASTSAAAVVVVLGLADAASSGSWRPQRGGEARSCFLRACPAGGRSRTG